MATSASTCIQPLRQPDVLREGDSDDDKMRGDLDQQQLTEDINALRQEDLPEELRKSIDIRKVKETYRKANSISILLTGKTGAGKSTLINGILGLDIKEMGAAKEGKSIKGACTTEVTEYTCKKGKITVTVWDSPGLQDGTKNQKEYLRQMYKQCTHRDLTIYCIRVTEGRFVRGRDNPDVIAMEKLSKKFGPEFWNNTIIVLTFANTLEAFHIEWEDLSKEEKSQQFNAEIQEWVDQIKEILTKDIKVPKEIVDNIQVIPAGHYKNPHLPNCKYWLSALWLHSLVTIPVPEKRVALTSINARRLKKEDKVKEKDLKKPADKQPIVLLNLGDKKLLSDSLGGGAALGAVVGSGIGVVGLIGGPIVAITVPVGVVLGAVIGSGVGVISAIVRLSL